MEALQELAKKMNVEILEIIPEFGSGIESINKRLEFKKMLNKLSREEADGILCTSLDRLTRSSTDMLKILELIDKKGIEIITLNGIYGQNPAEKLAITIHLAMAEYYRCTLSERIKRGIKAKRV